jgi:hypothetical protein
MLDALQYTWTGHTQSLLFGMLDADTIAVKFYRKFEDGQRGSIPSSP